MTNPVSIENLWKVYPARGNEHGQENLIALEDVSFELHEHEFVCVLGPSGCGKSTLLRIVAGLETADYGSVQVSSRPSVVFQEHGIFPWRSVAGNVGYPLQLRHEPRRTRKAKVDELLELVGLKEFRNYYPGQLSGGMRQRVSVARALADDGETLLMDEPFGALDEQTRVGLQQEILSIWRRTSKAVLFITHSVDESLILADRIIVMSHRPGRIIAQIQVPFERPRSLVSIRKDPRYAQITAELWDLLGRRDAE